MSTGYFTWRGTSIPFRTGDSIAVALMRAGERSLGTDTTGCRLRYFCGIGACQNCLVSVDGAIVEACLTPADAGLLVREVGMVV